MTKRLPIICTILLMILVIGCQSGADNMPLPEADNSEEEEETELVSTKPSDTSETAQKNLKETESVSEEPSDTSETGQKKVTEMPVPLTPSALTELVQPGDLIYQGAFRLPDEFVEIWGDQINFWSYSGCAMTYYQGGDPSGPNDGFPGSLFGVGHDQSQFVSEISIPVPVDSQNIDDLNTASTLQSPADITAGMFDYLELPTAGLEYLPAQGGQTKEKLHFCWGQHFQGDEPSHGWSELDLSDPQPAGPWLFGNYTNYVSNDYLFEIPESWADEYAPGKRLASGRFREGVWGGFGPALFAYSSWSDGNPLTPNSTLSTITPLLLYGIQEPGMIDISTSDSMKMDMYSEPDTWSGGAWLTAGDKSAVIFVGTKAIGNCWYGFANGIVWPYDCADDDTPPCPEVPEWPFSDRGYWADNIESRILFYNPADLAAVSRGKMETWEPQPYASLCIDDYLFDPGYEYERGKRQLLGACAFDRARGLLYIAERMVSADEEKSVIHVWQIES